MAEDKQDELYEEAGDESDEEKMYELADLFKIFGDSTRLRNQSRRSFRQRQREGNAASQRDLAQVHINSCCHRDAELL